MLTHLKLDNFKIWKSTGPMRLAPVTLLLGTNSSGKSSLIQSLLLIRQTVKGDDPNLDLNLGNPDAGDSVTLGQFRDVLCRHGDGPRIGIEFRWSETGASGDSTLFNARYRAGPAGSAELDSLRLGRDGQGFSVLRRKPGIYRLQLADERESRGQSADFRPQRSFALAPAALARLGADGERIRDVGPALLDELGRIIYLGPVRRLAQRDYVWSGRMPATIGDDGAKAVDALIASGVAALAAKRRGRTPSGDAALIAETGAWLKRMDLADALSVRPLGGSTRYELIVERQGEQTNLKDVGVGVSQVLPVIVAALHAAPGHIVIVEEPESHLHPLAESLLAELFAQVSRERRVQFIAETHSEHLFRRMQTLMARQQVDRDQVAMYFVEREGPAAKLRELVPNEFGAITNWPDKFFGDAIGETREQAKARAERELAAAKSGNADR
jgi:energy-coupling factor transporter ATP-binding protein EcfA2